MSLKTKFESGDTVYFRVYSSEISSGVVRDVAFDGSHGNTYAIVCEWGDKTKTVYLLECFLSDDPAYLRY